MCDHAVTKFLLKGLHPFSTVEQMPHLRGCSFQELETPLAQTNLGSSQRKQTGSLLQMDKID